jgi:hypothetical protein
MTKRQGIGKGKRFDIFRRDGFTCQYCGRSPPEVVLHLDHIVPVIEGGDNDEMNLITACRDCNLGKGKKPLGQLQRPDADLEWLEIQQEVAELRAYQEAKRTRDAVITELVETLQDTWCDYSGLDWHPNDSLMRRMLGKYVPELVEQAIIEVSIKQAGGYFRGSNDWAKYIWGVLRTMEREAQECPPSA